ncbi:MAG: hypothetical protein K0S12_2142 [Bacteroidetes bacterium]|nr:hypothetical protein [Bacteroidota bacterium]
MFKYLVAYSSVFFLFFGYPLTEKNIRYDLQSPDAVQLLPDTLREISGLTDIDSVSFACIQDENGIVFIYDIIKNTIRKQYTFNLNGDYEGIARVGKTIFVLRSDGVLFRISDYTNPAFKVTSYDTGIPANNNEGLCYDSEYNRLLIACKGKLEKGPEGKDRRAIYGFDLGTMKLTREPVYDFDVSVIKSVAEKQKVRLPQRTKKKDEVSLPVLKFMTSDIDIHPISKKLYLLSASDHLLFVFNGAGTVEHIQSLDPQMFNKPEGITFLENGDMFITNEGQNKKATLLRFNYRK